MNWNLHITGPAQKEFRRLPPRDQARVKEAFLAMQQDQEKTPYPGLALVKLDFLIGKKSRSNVGRTVKSAGNVPK
jgi:mRNA-degrading endonuclease RelE of RelBE toxin-antitoxin system